MTLARVMSGLTFLLLCALSAQAFAVQDVCVINNSSKTIRLIANGSPLDNSPSTIDYGPNGGDRNQCFHVSASINDIQIQLFLMDGAGQYQLVALSSEEDTYQVVDTIYFQNVPLAHAQFFLDSETDVGIWADGDKYCGSGLCVAHTDLDVVWRMYVTDQ